jgi:hypothetical protein
VHPLPTSFCQALSVLVLYLEELESLVAPGNHVFNCFKLEELFLGVL